MLSSNVSLYGYILHFVYRFIQLMNTWVGLTLAVVNNAALNKYSGLCVDICFHFSDELSYWVV